MLTVGKLIDIGFGRSQSWEDAGILQWSSKKSKKSSRKICREQLSWSKENT
jgi:predicted transcriptional regulator